MKKFINKHILINKFNTWLIEHGKLSLLVSIIIILLGLFLTSKLTIQSNMEDLLPANNEVLQQTQVFNKYFPSNETTIVVVESVNSEYLNSPEKHIQEIERFLSDFEKQLSTKNFITNSLFYIDLSGLNENLILYEDMDFYGNVESMFKQNDIEGLSSLYKDLKAEDPELKEYFSSKDSSIYLVFLKPTLTDDFVGSRDAFYNGVNEVIVSSQITTNTENLLVGLTGGAFIQDIEADAVAFDGLFSTFLFTLIIILLFILFSFGKIVLPLSTSIPLLGGAILSGSFAYLIYGSLNMFSLSFAILLLGLGIDFGVHILSRYLEEKKKNNQKKALLIALNATGPSILFGALTTALAFYAFIIGKFKAFEQMGVISGTGIILLCIMMFTMMPGLILILDRNKNIEKSKKRSYLELSTFIKFIVGFIIRKPLVMPLISIIVLIFLFPSVTNTKIIGDVSKIYPEELSSLTLAKTLEDNFDFSTNTISIYVDDIQKLKSLTSDLNNSHLIKSTSSILDFLPENQSVKLTTLDSLKILDPSLDFKPIEIEDLDSNLISNYVGLDHVYLIEITPALDLYKPGNYEIIKSLIYDLSGRYPVGMPVIMNEIVLLVTSDIINISILCLVIILIMLLFLYKDIIYSLITLLPLLLSLYTTIGIMNLFKIDINIFSIAAFPLIIGIGIDSSIHLMHRLRDSRAEIHLENLTHTGKAIVITSVTSIIGFSSLTRINHPGMANLGFAVAIGMSVCLIYTLLLLPSMYIFIQKLYLRKQ